MGIVRGTRWHLGWEGTLTEYKQDHPIRMSLWCIKLVRGTQLHLGWEGTLRSISRTTQCKDDCVGWWLEDSNCWMLEQCKDVTVVDKVHLGGHCFSCCKKTCFLWKGWDF